MTAIQSPKHSAVQAARALHLKKNRVETGHLLVEGPHPVDEALKAGLTPMRVFVRDDALTAPAVAPLLEAMPSQTERFEVSADAMQRLASTASAPPIAVVFERSAPIALASLFVQGATTALPPLLLVLDSVQDPGNLGSLMRSARAFGVTGLLLSGHTVAPDGPKVIRASAGLGLGLPTVMVPTLDQALSALATASCVIYAGACASSFEASEANAGRVIGYRDVDYTGPCALLLGSEGDGLPEACFAAHGLQPIGIPMAAGVDSLNVAVSGAILLAEAAAQREQREQRNAV